MKIYLKLFWAFFRAGLFTIGGGLAMLPLIHKYIVEDGKWLSEEEMVDGIAVAQSLPGVLAINIATYVGKKAGGPFGAIVSAIGTALPSFVIIILVSLFLGSVEDNVFVDGALAGIRAAAAAMIFIAGIKLGAKVLKGTVTYILAVAAFVLIVFFEIKIAYIILSAAVLGIIYNIIITSKGVK